MHPVLAKAKMKKKMDKRETHSVGDEERSEVRVLALCVCVAIIFTHTKDFVCKS